jgi:hypothetical protein
MKFNSRLNTILNDETGKKSIEKNNLVNWINLSDS